MAKTHTPQNKPTSRSPVVDGVKTTYGNLAKALGITREGARTRYVKAKSIHGKVLSAHIATPVIDPERVMLRQVRAESQETDRLIRHALMHGPTHTALVFKMDVDAVKQLLQTVKK